MNPERWQQIDQLFHSALEREPGVRAAFLAQACTGDEALRREVESLIGSHEQSDSFIEAPAADLAAELLAGKESELTAGQAVGPYKIVSLLGKGGMGEVYLAQDVRLGRQVALKRLPAQFTLDADRVRRFGQEARAVSALNHPNIVTIYEIGQSNSLHFITTEFIDGETLREHLARKRRSLDEVLDVAIQIASALAAAHAAGIVHRDIKPENIMIRPDGYVKVLDFGLAKLVEQKNKSLLDLEDSTARQTARGLILGTVNYMSPEQAKGEKIDERTDIFSLGVVIHEMIAGRTPFAGDSMAETIANLINAEPQPLSDFVTNVPDEIQRTILNTLRKNRDERYQTMNDVLADLKDLRKDLTLEEKLEYSQSQHTRPTKLLHASTGDAIRAVETQRGFSPKLRRREVVFASAILIAIIAAQAVVFYFLKGTFFPWRTEVAGSKQTIAVLPLKPINTASRDEIYEFGIADSLIHRLSSMKGFIVRPLSATRKYADVGQDPIAAGKEQQVDYVLASNYQVAGGKIRVTAQLINVVSGQIEETYKSEADATNIFAMQDAIAGAFANKLQTRFAATAGGPAAKRGTTNEEAYRLYLHGKNLTDKRSVKDALKAVEYFEQAIRLDPNYALAFARMADAYVALAILGGGLPGEEYEKARAAVNKALELDNNLAEAYSTRADIKYGYEWDFDGAEKDLQRALELDPNCDASDRPNWLAHSGRFDEAIAAVEKKLEIDPNSIVLQQVRGRILYLARRYDEAIAQLKRVIELDEKFGTAYGVLWQAYEMKGDYAGAYQAFIDFKKRTNPEHVKVYQKAYEIGGWQGVRRKFLEFSKLDENKPESNLFVIARQYAWLGEKEQALVYLNKAVERRHTQVLMLKVDPAFDILRDDPRFAELVNRIGLK